MTEEDAARIVEVTQGVPLAIKIAAGLYLEKTDLEIIIEKADGKRRVVDEMVRRYLLHTHVDQSERAKLYSLALLRRADHPASVAVALGLSPEEAKTSYSATLSRLQRRYSFIFTEKEEPSLHQEVRDFLRLWLLEHRKEPEIVSIIQRLTNALEADLKRLEEHLSESTLKDRLQDDEWLGTYLDLTEQHFWLNPTESVDFALPFMIAAAIYRREATQDVADIGTFFEKHIRHDARNRWTWARQSLTFTTSRSRFSEEFTELEALVKLAHEPCPSFPKPLPDYRQELEAALWWRLAESNSDYDEALYWYEQALTRLDKETELREATAGIYHQLGQFYGWLDNYAESLTFLSRAIELKAPDYSQAYIERGTAYFKLKEYQHAIEDYTQAIALERTARTYEQRGTAYFKLKEYQHAIEDYTQAIALEPTAVGYHVRGSFFLLLRNSYAAWNDFDRAYELEQDIGPAWMSIWTKMGKQRDGENEELAIQLENMATIDVKSYLSYVCRGVALGLRGRVKDGLKQMEQAIQLEPERRSAFFWKGMLSLYYYQKAAAYEEAIKAIKQALVLDMPPIFLTPLYWLEKDKPEVFEQYIKPLLVEYDM